MVVWLGPNGRYLAAVGNGLIAGQRKRIGYSFPMLETELDFEV